MRGKYSPDPPLENYYEKPLDDSSDGKWHPISQEPVTDPPVQVIGVEIWYLKEWADNWEDMHNEDLDSRVFHDKNGNETSEEEDEDGNYHKLIRCCGYDRPPDFPDIEVRASGREKEYVTVHDYLTTLHD